MSKKNNHQNVKLSTAKKLIIKTLKVNLVPYLQSSPGIGKSDLYKEIAKEFNLKVIDIRLAQCDPTDLNGFPFVNKDTNTASFIPMDIFPIKTTKIPKDYEGWLLVLDELPQASPAVQKASFKLILDRMVGLHHLHKNCFIVAAGNLITDNAFVEEMPTALQSRLIHIETHADAEEWIDWALKNDIDHRIISYIEYKPDHLHAFKPTHNDRTFACPRTWEFASKLIKDEVSLSDDNDLITLLSGTISVGIANEFKIFNKIYKELIKFEQILTDPEKIQVPTEPGILYALTGTISHNASASTMAPLIKFIERIPTEFQVITIRNIIKRDSTMLENTHISEWISNTASTAFSF